MTAPHMYEERPGLSEVGRALMTGGALSSDWAPAYAAVPRAAFLPDLMWPFDMRAGAAVAVSRAEDPDTWTRCAEADVPIVTQWDDGDHHGTAPGYVSTSSMSMPSVVLRMLQDLAVRPDNRVLEIGTGTGWNAALLAHRLGAARVTSVEIDAAVAAQARTALERSGLPVRVVHGDGSHGWPDGAPYDRVIATAGVRTVPHAWVRQCRPEGTIVTPWGTHFSNGDAVAKLVVSSDGERAQGRFTGPVEFMKLRDQRLPEVNHREYVRDSVAEGDESESAVSEAEFVGLQSGRFSPLRFALGLLVPNCLQVVAEPADGSRVVWFYELGAQRSWACVQFRVGRRARVWQSGPRRLWSDVEGAYRWWTDQGEPGHERFGMTVGVEGQRVWLDEPSAAWEV